jgi:hypothetical protein
MDDLVTKYIELRDTKAKIEAEMKAKVAKIVGIMDKIEAAILAEFQESGVESIRTKDGTAYKQTRTSATVADWDAALNYIQANNLWHMLERRVSKQAVEQFKEAHGELPPGLNWREEVVINIRRSA